MRGSSETATPPAVRRIGRYQLIRPLGHGGMAQVYLAQFSGSGGFAKRVAVKQLHPHLASDMRNVESFLDEARLLARLSHPNVIQVYDVGEEQGRYYVALEFVEGASLAQLLAAARQRGVLLSSEVALMVGTAACRALDYIHGFRDEQGRHLRIIHRDVSPQNLMVSRTGEVKLLDFGVAKAATNLRHTRTPALTGKLAYMSPEQISLEVQLDQRSDLFSLGVTLFELVAGQRPFSGANEFLLLNAVLNAPAPDLRSLVPSTPEGLIELIERAMRKDRTQRFKDAAEMGQALGALLAQSDATRVARRLAEVVESFAPRVLHDEDGEGADPLAEGSPKRNGSSPQDAVIEETRAANGSLFTPPGRRPRLRRALRLVVPAALLALLGGLVVHSYTRARRSSGGRATSFGLEEGQVISPRAGEPPGTQPLPRLPPPRPPATGAEATNGEARATPRSGAHAVTTRRKRRQLAGGVLVVRTKPATLVRVDGRSFGVAPGPIPLAPGLHKVVLAQAALGIRLEERVRISKGKTVELVRELGKGKLRVFVKPYGEVFVDGTLVGLTPLEGPVELYEGQHVVRVYCERTGKEARRAVRLRAGQMHTLNIDLR